MFETHTVYFYKVKSKNASELLAEQVFYNSRIQIDGHYIPGKGWITKGIYCIAHFVAENGSFIVYNDFKEKFDLDINFLTFPGIKSAIKIYTRTKDINIQSKTFE